MIQHTFGTLQVQQSPQGHGTAGVDSLQSLTAG